MEELIILLKLYNKINYTLFIIIKFLFHTLLNTSLFYYKIFIYSIIKIYFR